MPRLGGAISIHFQEEKKETEKEKDFSTPHLRQKSRPHSRSSHSRELELQEPLPLPQRPLNKKKRKEKERLLPEGLSGFLTWKMVYFDNSWVGIVSFNRRGGVRGFVRHGRSRVVLVGRRRSVRVLRIVIVAHLSGPLSLYYFFEGFWKIE
jgi:hypothetical protein